MDKQGPMNARRGDMLYVAGSSLLLVYVGLLTRGPLFFLGEEAVYHVSGTIAFLFSFSLTFFAAAFFIWKKPRSGKGQIVLASGCSVVAFVLLMVVNAGFSSLGDVWVVVGCLLGSSASIYLIIWMDFLAQRAMDRGQRLLLWSNVVLTCIVFSDTRLRDF